MKKPSERLSISWTRTAVLCQVRRLGTNRVKGAAWGNAESDGIDTGFCPLNAFIIGVV